MTGGNMLVGHDHLHQIHHLHHLLHLLNLLHLRKHCPDTSQLSNVAINRFTKFDKKLFCVSKKNLYRRISSVREYVEKLPYRINL